MGNKTKTQMRSDLATDLKITIDTEITVAELNRSIERAFSDMSRFLPDEKIHEDSHQFAVADEKVTFPKDAGDDVDEIVDAMDISTVVAGDYCSSHGETITQPDVPRPLVITLTDASNSIACMTIIIEGLDKDDQGIQETFFYSLGDSKTITGKKYFKSIYTIEFDQIAGNGADDILDIGYSAYTDVWVYLAHSPIKWQSESATNDNDSDAVVVRNTDFYMDYANGRVKAIAATTPGIDAEDICTFAYKKSQIGIDISDLPDLIRVQRVEYPVGQVPQTFVSFDVFGKYIVVTGAGESEEQRPMAEDEQYRIYYDACQQMPGENTPGTEPKFLTNTVMMAAAAYALYILALKQEHQAATDIAGARTALGNATGTHSALALALADLKKYLDNNSTNDAVDSLGSANGTHSALALALASLEKYLYNAESTSNAIDSLGSANGDHSAFALAVTAMKKYLDNNNTTDAAGLLDDINNSDEDLRHEIETALAAINSYLDIVTADLESANAVRASYIDGTDYVDAADTTSILKFLTDGAALLNTVAVGGEGADVPRAYREFAQSAKDALVGSYENDRAMYLQNATARTNAAMGYANEAAQHLSFLRSFVERSAGYIAIANTFAVEADARIAGINAYLRQAEGYVAVANAFGVEAGARLEEINAYLRQAEGYVAVAGTFARQAEDLLVQIRSYLDQANSYATAASSDMALADRFKAEADERRNEVYSIWKDRKQYIGDFTAGSMRQMPSYK